jgi:uncharacterized membrane protein
MLIVFPLGLLGTSVIFDIVYLFTQNPTYSLVSFWMIFAGLIGGLIASPFGTIDWLAIPQGPRAKRVGLVHGGGNLIVMLLFGLSLWGRWNVTEHRPDTVALILSGAGFLLSLATAWLGGELVDRLAVGVEEGAHLNSPSSLSNRPAAETDDSGRVF